MINKIKIGLLLSEHRKDDLSPRTIEKTETCWEWDGHIQGCPM